MSTTKTKLSRRNFMLAVGVGGAAAATAIVAGKSPTAQSSPDKSKRSGKGYQVSEHINNYYRTAKV